MALHTFKASYFHRLIRQDWNPFTPDRITISEQTVEHKRRNWHLISCDTQTYHFQNIIGVDVDKALFGANIIIHTTGNGRISVGGFSKRKSNKIAALCKEYITKHTQGSLINQFKSTYASLPNNNIAYSLADEVKKLKQLFDEGVISQSEFEVQKSKLLSS